MKDKYSQLLSILVAIFFISPFCQGRVGELIMFGLFFLMLIIIIRIIKSFDLKPRYVFLYVLIASISFSLAIIGGDEKFSFSEYNYLLVISYLINTIFFLGAILTINRKIFLETKIDRDTIKGGVCVYLLIGMMWSFLYSIISVFDDNAFSQALEPRDFETTIYMSFTTLSTLGYGDITPINKIAMRLANIESIIGQLYPAVYIARLVSLYTAQELTDRN